MSGKRISTEALISLRNRLSGLPSGSSERRSMMHETEKLYGASEATLYRALRKHNRPKALRRSDCGQPRILAVPLCQHTCLLKFNFLGGVTGMIVS